MQYEVENKYPVEDLAPIAERTMRLGAKFDEPIEQVDKYFAHPMRDFAQTDEALRIRSVGETNVITYKGPKIDAATKTRVELELPLGAGVSQAAQYAELLTVLGFMPRKEVRKRRVCGRCSWDQWPVDIALDEVAGLGKFVELEIGAEQDQLDDARSSLLGLAEHLGLADPERRSYLELLLETE